MSEKLLKKNTLETSLGAKPEKGYVRASGAYEEVAPLLNGASEEHRREYNNIGIALAALAGKNTSVKDFGILSERLLRLEAALEKPKRAEKYGALVPPKIESSAAHKLDKGFPKVPKASLEAITLAEKKRAFNEKVERQAAGLIESEASKKAHVYTQGLKWKDRDLLGSFESQSRRRQVSLPPDETKDPNVSGSEPSEDVDDDILSPKTRAKVGGMFAEGIKRLREIRGANDVSLAEQGKVDSTDEIQGDAPTLQEPQAEDLVKTVKAPRIRSKLPPKREGSSYPHVASMPEAPRPLMGALDNLRRGRTDADLEKGAVPAPDISLEDWIPAFQEYEETGGTFNASERPRAEKVENLKKVIESLAVLTPREKLITLPDEYQMETPRPPEPPPSPIEKWTDDPHDEWQPEQFAAYQEKSEPTHRGGVYDSSMWTGRGFKGFRDTTRPQAEISPPHNRSSSTSASPAPETVPVVSGIGGEVPTRSVAPEVVSGRRPPRGLLGRLATAAALAMGLASIPDPTSKTESPATKTEAQITKVEPTGVAASIERRVPENVGIPLQDFTVEITPPKTPEGVTVFEFRKRVAPPAPAPASESALRRVIETGPTRYVGSHIVPKPLIEESPQPLKVEYGSSPDTKMNTKGVMVDPAQPRLFIDKTKAVTAYGGDYESRLKLALEYIQSHPGSAVHLEIEDKRGKYLGEYSINSQGLQYLGPIGGNERPGFFTRIWRLFKEKPKIDPDTFVRQIP